MKVTLERSGGFGGISQTNNISTDQMPEKEAREVAALVEEAGFFGLPSVIHSTEQGADRFQYKITVESERGVHTVQVDEAAVPPGLQPLLNWMKNSARRLAGR
jgi:hypothetical protein